MLCILSQPFTNWKIIMVKRVAIDSKKNHYLVETDSADTKILAVLSKLEGNDVGVDIGDLTLIDGSSGSFNYGEFTGDVTGEVTFSDIRIADASTLYKTINISPFGMAPSATLGLTEIVDYDTDTDESNNSFGLLVYDFATDDTTALIMGQLVVPNDWRKGTDIEIYGTFNKSTSSETEALVIFEHVIVDPDGGSIPATTSLTTDSNTTASDTTLERILLATLSADDIAIGNIVYFSVARNVQTDSYAGSLYFHGIQASYQVDVVGSDGKFTKTNGSDVE